MIPEFGHFALILAMVLAVIQSSLPLIGAHRGDASLMAVAPIAAKAQFVTIAIAFGILIYAFVVSDFSVINVAQNSHSDKPMLYKVAAAWGNHEGSMVLWVLILSLFGAMVAFSAASLPSGLMARVLAIQGMIGATFLGYILAVSNPFLRLDPAPFDGRSLNPLLQDPGLAFHPPFLYFGYVGLSMTFSFAVAALIEGKVDPAWARWVRPWALAAWTALTMGIGMGAWWAYYELGWGGWWYWDPVENASFMPWLVATALLHSAIVVEKRDTLKSWTILLAILAFSLSLLGTFLVRSGVLNSVHAFASDPTRGVFILGLLVFAIGGSLTLFAIRAPGLKSGAVFQPISREGALIFNNLFLIVACASVLLGTLFPLFADAFGYKASAGLPYFNNTFGPLVLPLLIALPLGPMLAWKRGRLLGAVERLFAAVVAAGAATIAVYAFLDGTPILAPFGIGLAVWVIIGTLIEFGGRIKLFNVPFTQSLRRARHLPRAAYGMTVAHIGMGVLIAGVTGATAWKTETITVAGIGDHIQNGRYELVLESVDEIQGPNYIAQRGVFRVFSKGEELGLLQPEKRFYPVQQMPTTEAGIHTNGLGDLYVVLGDRQNNGKGWVVKVWYNPLVPWLWMGFILMMVGGLLSLSDRRYRVGAPSGSRQKSAAPHPQPAE